MKTLLVASAICFVVGACQPPPPPQVYYTQRTIYYKPKPSTTPVKYGAGSSRTYSGSRDSAESFRATTR